VQEVRYRRKPFFVKGVWRKMVLFYFTDIRDALAPDGIASLPDEAKVIRGDPERIKGNDRSKRSDVDGEKTGELTKRGDAFGKCSLPAFHVDKDSLLNFTFFMDRMQKPEAKD